MLHARGENNEEQLLETTSASLTQHEAPNLTQMSSAAATLKFQNRVGEDEGKDSGNESAEADSDFEEKKEENFKKIQNSLIGMNVSCSYQYYCRIKLLRDKHLRNIVEIEITTRFILH